MWLAAVSFLSLLPFCKDSPESLRSPLTHALPEVFRQARQGSSGRFAAILVQGAAEFYFWQFPGNRHMAIATASLQLFPGIGSSGRSAVVLMQKLIRHTCGHFCYVRTRPAVCGHLSSETHPAGSLYSNTLRLLSYLKSQDLSSIFTPACLSGKGSLPCHSPFLLLYILIKKRSYAAVSFAYFRRKVKKIIVYSALFWHTLLYKMHNSHPGMKWNFKAKI